MAADDRDTRRLQDELAELRGDLPRKADAAGLRAVRDELTRLSDRVGADLDRYAARLSDARGRLDEVEAALAGAQRDLTGRIDELERRQNWVLRHIGRAGGDRTADLDGLPGLAALAARAERGTALAAGLLDATERRALRDRLAERQRWHGEHRQAVETVLAASRAVAHSEPGAADRPGAVSAFRRATAELVELRQREKAVTVAAGEAQAVLDADEERAREGAAVLAEGRRAGEELRARVDARLRAMLRDAELPPAWFLAVLGPTPPSDADRWIATGVELVAYRATYGVTSPEDALGDPPGPDAPAHRVERHRRLAAAVRRRA